MKGVTHLGRSPSPQVRERFGQVPGEEHWYAQFLCVLGEGRRGAQFLCADGGGDKGCETGKRKGREKGINGGKEKADDARETVVADDVCWTDDDDGGKGGGRETLRLEAGLITDVV